MLGLPVGNKRPGVHAGIAFRDRSKLRQRKVEHVVRFVDAPSLDETDADIVDCLPVSAGYALLHNVVVVFHSERVFLGGRQFAVELGLVFQDLLPAFF